MSAGPLSVSKNADVYVMTDRGFDRMIHGSNGFACLVVRSASGEPACGSVKAMVPKNRPARIAGTKRCTKSSLAKFSIKRIAAMVKNG